MNSLNVALDTEATDVTVGSDTNPGNVFASGTVSGGDWAPGEVTNSAGVAGYTSYSTTAVGNNGFGSTDNIPAVQFNTSGSGLADLYPTPPGSADTLNLNLANTGTTPAYVRRCQLRWPLTARTSSPPQVTPTPLFPGVLRVGLR